jgi:uroporphyrin-III C-methyltransferase/precorrin-2 dehydrogenase/sirohydrochlorin ferrochelatase
VPGVTSAFAAAAESEIPLTLRGVSSGIVFATGQDAEGEVLPGWVGLALAGVTVAIYMGRSVAARVADRLMEAGLPPSTPAVIIENASLPDRRVRGGVLRDLREHRGGDDMPGPALILIGDAVAQGALSGAEPIAAARVLAA